MKERMKWLICLLICAIITFITSFFITDNDSVVFQISVWIVSLIILLLSSLAGFLLGYLLSGVCFGICRVISSLFEEGAMNTEVKKRRFFLVFDCAYLVFSLIILAKFVSDFLFAQFTPTYLLCSGSLGFFNGALLLLFWKGSKKQPKNIWIE